MPLPASYLQRPRMATPRGRSFPLASIRKNSFVNPVAVDDDGYSVGHAGVNTATINMTLGGALVTGGVGIPDFSRNAVITVTHASAVVAMNGVVTGEDARGNVITEDWSVTAGSTSKVFTGKKSFARITKITETAAGDASTNTVKAGTGQVFGLDVPVAVASAVKEVAIGAVVTTGTLVATSTAAADDRLGTYSPSAAPEGTNDYHVWFLTDDPQTD